MSIATTRTELLKQLEEVECQLSPENLHCDGEISRAQARYKAARLEERKARILRALETAS